MALNNWSFDAMNFIQNLGMPQRLIAAAVVMLILALLLLRKRGSTGGKASAPKTSSAKGSKTSAKGDRRGAGRGAKATSSDKKGRRGRRGKKNADDDADDVTPTAVGRMVPRLPSAAGGGGDDPFAGAIGSLDATQGSAPTANGAVAEPGWPMADRAWPTDGAAAPAAETDQTTGVIDAVEELPADTDQTGWVEEEIEGFDPATGWGEDTSQDGEPAPVDETETEAEANAGWTDDGADWTSDGATWETVDGDQQEESTWTTAEEGTPQTEWTNSEAEPEEAVAAWDPVEDEPVAETETSFTDWGTDEANEEAWTETPSEPIVDEQADFAWDGGESTADVVETPVLVAATMADEAADTMAVTDTVADGFGEIATNMPLVFDDAPIDESQQSLSGFDQTVQSSAAEALDAPATPVADEAFAAYDDAIQADAPTSIDAYGDIAIGEVPMLAETTMSGFVPLPSDVDQVLVDVSEPISVSMPDLDAVSADAIAVHVAPEMTPQPEVVETIFDTPLMSAEITAPPVEAPHYEAPQVTAEITAPPVEAPHYEAPQVTAEITAPPVETPHYEAPQVTAEITAPPVEAPHYEAPSLETVDALIHGPAALRAPIVEPAPVDDEPVVAEVEEDIHLPAVPSMVMSAPLRNPLDRWAHLTPSSDMAAPVSSPLRSWERLVPGQPAARFGADAPLEPIVSHVSAPVAPAEQTPATTWWDSPDESQQTQRRGRFALGGYALCPGHQVVSGVTFRDCINPPPVDWVIGPVSGPVPAGTLVLNVDGCMNCRVEDLVVLMESGFAPTTDGFSLRLTGLQQGPFAASGTFVIH